MCKARGGKCTFHQMNSLVADNIMSLNQPKISTVEGYIIAFNNSFKSIMI